MKKMYALQDIQQWETLKEGVQGSRGVVIFKRSPICPISAAAEREFDVWYERIPDDEDILCAKVDVIASHPLSRHIAKELGVEHQSPQVLWISPEGNVRWHVVTIPLPEIIFVPLLTSEALWRRGI